MTRVLNCGRWKRNCLRPKERLRVADLDLASAERAAATARADHEAYCQQEATEVTKLGGAVVRGALLASEAVPYSGLAGIRGEHAQTSGAGERGPGRRHRRHGTTDSGGCGNGAVCSGAAGRADGA